MRAGRFDRRVGGASTRAAGASIDVAQVREMKAQGKGAAAIAKALSIPSRERLSATRMKGNEPAKLMLTADQRRALRLLVSAPRGASEALMLSYGFRRDMLTELVLGGLVTVVTETMRTGAATMKVERYRITESGREVLRAAGG
jgi:hypothetical protein